MGAVRGADPELSTGRAASCGRIDAGVGGLRHPADVTSLPALVALAPHRTVLRLGPGHRLIGIDPATALDVDGLSPPLAQMVDELTAPARPPDVLARAVERGAAADEADLLLRDLLDAGALVDVAGAQRRARHRTGSAVVVHGSGPVAVGVVVGLVQAGVGMVYVGCAGVVSAADLGTGFVDADRGRDRLVAVAAAVRRLCPGVRTRPPPLRLVPDLVVLADALAVDPDLTTELHITGTAHLTAALRDGTGVVGPLVLPGRTACLRCVELRRGVHDAAWARVPAQLVDRTGSADPACVTATVALATAQALAALDGAAGAVDVPSTLEATLQVDPARGTLTRRVWEPVAGCGCGATTCARATRRVCGERVGVRRGDNK